MKKLLKDDLLWLAGFLVLLMVIAASSPAFAGDEKKYIPKTPTTGENLTPTQTSTVNPVIAPTITSTSGGGASNANLYNSEDSLGVAFGTTAPIPLEGYPACWVPGKGFRRGHSVLWGIWAASAVAVKDAACQADLEAQRAHELRMAELALETLKAKGENDKAATERVQAECGWELCATK